jgi:hypothetical protein
MPICTSSKVTSSSSWRERNRKIHCRDAEEDGNKRSELHRRPQREMEINDLTSEVIGSAMEVHRALGPGLLESAYEECLCHELVLRGVDFERQKPLPVTFKRVRLDCATVSI